MGQGQMRTSDDGSVSSSVLYLGGVLLEQVPALASDTLEPMVQRILTGSQPSSVPGPTFGSCI
jgi:hypothetical protein